MPGGLRTEIHLGSDDTDGAFCLLLDFPPPGWSLPSHRHLGEIETIHILEGEFDMQVGARSMLATAGETVMVPKGVMHSGSNRTELPGRRIVIFSPGGMERFFLETGTATPDAEIDPQAALAAANRHGWRFGDSAD